MKNKIRAVVINMKEHTFKKKVMNSTMKCLNIRNYKFLPGFKFNEYMFKNGGQHIEFNGHLYEYGPYKGGYPFRREYLSFNSIGCCISNHVCRNDQLDDFYTIIFEDDARYICNHAKFIDYIDNLPKKEDYDIILLSDCTWSSTAYQVGVQYNEYYYYLPLPYMDISGTHAYIVNSEVLETLNVNLNFTLAADDYLNFCINKFNLKVLVPKEVLFTQRPWAYSNQKYLSNK